MYAANDAWPLMSPADENMWGVSAENMKYFLDTEKKKLFARANDINSHWLRYQMLTLRGSYNSKPRLQNVPVELPFPDDESLGQEGRTKTIYEQQEFVAGTEIGGIK